jgi:hypothetical protein
VSPSAGPVDAPASPSATPVAVLRPPVRLWLQPLAPPKVPSVPLSQVRPSAPTVEPSPGPPPPASIALSARYRPASRWPGGWLPLLGQPAPSPQPPSVPPSAAPVAVYPSLSAYRVDRPRYTYAAWAWQGVPARAANHTRLERWRTTAR